MRGRVGTVSSQESELERERQAHTYGCNYVCATDRPILCSRVCGLTLAPSKEPFACLGYALKASRRTMVNEDLSPPTSMRSCMSGLYGQELTIVSAPLSHISLTICYLVTDVGKEESMNADNARTSPPSFRGDLSSSWNALCQLILTLPTLASVLNFSNSMHG